MNQSPLNDLIGLRLTSHKCIEDYVQVTLEDGAAVLSVYNPCEVRGPESESRHTIRSVIGRRLHEVATRPDLVELKFGEGWSIAVDIRDEAFTGPEAMVLHRPGKSPVVWT